jgi:hypothetical protein
MDEIARLTAQLLQEREMRRVAERRARAFSQVNAKLREKLKQLARHNVCHPPAEAPRAEA